MSNAATTESNLWSWLNKVKPLFRELLHMTRIENSAGLGTPDTEGCLSGRQFWIELKCCKRPRNPDTKLEIKFRIAQPPWHRRRLAAGGRMYTLVQVGSGSGHGANRYLVHSEHVELLKAGVNEEVLRELSLCDPQAKAKHIIFLAADIYENNSTR
ncbi:MAG: hypothetical protein V3S55_15335 [Nitrospiraceae bacterium]